MQAAAAAPAPAPVAPPPPQRRRVYTAVDPRFEWARTEDADTLVLDVSGFRKEELKVLYNTSRKLKVTGERPVDDGARWARFLKSFPVPRNVDAGAIRAMMDKEEALLFVILPKGSQPPSSSTDRQKEQRPESSVSVPHGEQKGGTGSADGSSGSSTGSFWSAQEDAEKNRIEENKMVPEETREKIREEEIATQDVPRTDRGADDGEGKNKRWWKKIRPLHVLGLVLILALAGVGASILYVLLL